MIYVYFILKYLKMQILYYHSRLIILFLLLRIYEMTDVIVNVILYVFIYLLQKY